VQVLDSFAAVDTGLGLGGGTVDAAAAGLVLVVLAGLEFPIVTVRVT
jgi:hypothetical protein